MTGLELAKQGKCGDCEAVLPHGPWTDEQIAEVVADTGEPDFADWCDECLVSNCFGGDPVYAARMLGRPVRLGFATLLGVR
jgi:hypothetical protein